jgi:antitoxin MazE
MFILLVDNVYTFVYHMDGGLKIMKTTSSVKKWGNSLAVRIPTAVAQDLGLSENSSVQIISDGIIATIQPKKRKKISLDELVAAITPDNIHEEVDWGKPVGKEVW